LGVDVEAIARRCRDLVVEELLRDRRLRREILLAIAREPATRDDVRRVEDGLFRLEDRLVRLEERVSRLEERLARLEDRVSKLEERVVVLEEGVSRLEERVDGLASRLDLMVRVFLVFNAGILAGVLGVLVRLMMAGP
jgi:predicted nuclease with TOPRIM domain